jgi:hypothetical protein
MLTILQTQCIVNSARTSLEKLWSTFNRKPVTAGIDGDPSDEDDPQEPKKKEQEMSDKERGCAIAQLG